MTLPTRRELMRRLDACMTAIQVLTRAVSQDFETVGQELQTTRVLVADQAARIDRLERILQLREGRDVA